MPRIRVLQDPASGTLWSTHLDGAATEVRQGLPGRERLASRQHDDAAAALRWATREEWARLKKGLVLVDPAAAWGEPRLHRWIGGAYTGAMPIAPDGAGGVFCSRYLEADGMIRVHPDGTVAPGLALPPERLVWQAAPAPAHGTVLLQVDGGILRWTPETGLSEALVDYRANPGFLSVGGDRVACYDGSAALVIALGSGTVLLRVPLQAELHAGHSPQMTGALSPDGALLAVCARPGEILLFDVGTGQQRPPLRGDFAMVRQLDILPDRRRLLLTEVYGRWSLRCLDLATGQADPGWPELRTEGGAVAVAPAGDRVAVAGRQSIAIHHLDSLTSPRSFALEHAVKRCALAWLAADTLAVRTDYGCASLYAVP